MKGDWVDRFGELRTHSPYLVSGTDSAFAAGRFAFLLGLRGPAYSLSTMCSSSLVALHAAVQALRAGECDLAVAGGTNALTSGASSVELSQLGALSPDGRCKPFSAEADGYGRGEGAGVLVLKRLADAIADGDRVVGVIRGSAINHDGRSSGLTVPSGPAQREVIREALADAALAPSEIDYLECHGPGTPLGDPIEVRAAGEAYGEGRDGERPLLLGSAKQVVGHLEAAAGVAGVVKVLMALRRERLPANRVPAFNPELPLGEFPLRVVTEPRPWPRGERPRRAGVSSFGLSGTNAHVIVEEAPAAPLAAPSEPGDGPFLWPVAGRSEAHVRAYAAALVRHDAPDADIGRSLLDTRAWEPVRGVLVGHDRAELVAAVERMPVARVAAGRLAFVFNGAGAQRAGMGVDSYARHEVFRLAFESALAAIQPHVRGDLRRIMWGDDERLHLVEWSAPASFVIQVAQTALWRSVGVEPWAVIGHSQGEFAAAWAAGVLSLEDAARLLAVRSRLMNELGPGGAMVAVAADEAAVREALVPGAEIAVVNAPRSVVVSGLEAAVSAVAERFAARGVRTTRLAVSVAYHSAFVEPMVAALEDAAASVVPAEGTVRLLPTCRTAHAFGTPEYWGAQARGVVAFAEATALASELGVSRFLEVGPSRVLSGLVGQTLEAREPLAVATADGPEPESFVRAMGLLWASGHDVDLRSVLPAGHRTTLPHTVWQRRRFWLEPAEAPRSGEPTGHPLLGVRVPAAGAAALYETSLSTARHAWLADHEVGGKVYLPATAMLELLRAAGEHARGVPVVVRSASLERPLVLVGRAPLRVQVWVSEDGATQLWSQPEDAPAGEWAHHVTAVVEPDTEAPRRLDVAALRAGLAEVPVPALQERFAAGGLVYGPAFRGLAELWGRDGLAVGRLVTPAGVPVDGVPVPPAVVDAAVQAAIGAPGASLGLPFEVGAFRARGGAAAWVVVQRDGERHDLDVLDATGAVIARVEGLRTRALGSGADVSDAVYGEEWVSAPGSSAGGADDVVVEVRGEVVAAMTSLVSTLQSATGEGRTLVVAEGALAGAVRGLVRTLEVERPAWRVVAVEGTSADAEQERGRTDDERVVRWRGGVREVARLVRRGSPSLPVSASFRLEKSPAGDLSGLRFVARERVEPGPGEVELRVDATGLNFRDVMTALGFDLGTTSPLGLEASGVVTRAGDGVAFRPGDRVMVMAGGCFAPYVTVDARMASPVPAGWSALQAAAAPLAYLTAWYGLVILGGLKAGEKVLIHAAAGGVGQAAVQVARWVGAEVYATASPSKWALLRSQGIEHLASSRDAGFGAQWKDAGIDVVLDALAGELVDAGLGLLRPGGRFIEMGKTDVRDPAEVSAKHGVEYHAFDLLDVDPDVVSAMFGRLSEGFGVGSLRAPDVTAYDLQDVATAFRTMAGGGHTGKLVVRTGAGNVRGDGAVVVTGGLGGLARQAARWAVSRGARELVLLSRRGSATPGAAELVAELGATGARVDVVAADVTDEAAVRSALAGRVVRGVLHTAGVLDDALLPNVTAAQVSAVFGPKVVGLQVLERVTAGADLDWFVVFSSVVGVVGNRGQTVYGAANGWLDARMAERRAQGLPGTSIRWGLWSDSGMGKGVELEGGVVGLTDRDGAALLEVAVRRGMSEPVASRFDWKAVPTAPRVVSVLRDLVRPRATRGAAADGAFGKRVASLPPADRAAAVLDAVRSDVAQVLSVAPDKVGDATPLFDLGLDSLLAIELRNALGKRLGERLPATLAFDFPSVAALATELSRRLGLDAAPAAVAATVRTAHDSAEPIAIVGLACRFPAGANDPDAYWQLLERAAPVAVPVPADRWDHSRWYQPGPPAPGKTYCARVAVVDDPAGFDAPFFGLTAREAEMIDPEHRMFLEVGWEALEHAGVRIDDLVGSRTGVWVGILPSEYAARIDLERRAASPYALTGADISFAAGRFSYLLGLRGPAVAVSTACSSSLVAIHDAVRGLRAGDCDLAVAGGVALVADPAQVVIRSQIGALSPDGTCKTFDAAADGYGRGEGAGVLVLKRLSDALAAGDVVHGVIRGVAVNHDGRSSGLTVPSGPAQQALIEHALADARLEPTDVDFLECHGTGTKLGDPIEVRAAGEVYSRGRSDARPLLLGSAKAVVGHLEAAAGVAGVIKLVLALGRERVPPTHVHTVNPELPLAEFPLELVTEGRAWPRGPRRRVGAVSSFGLSGTNAHVIVEEGPPPPAAATPHRHHGPRVVARRQPVRGRRPRAGPPAGRARPRPRRRRRVAARAARRRGARRARRGRPLRARGRARPDGGHHRPRRPHRVRVQRGRRAAARHGRRVVPPPPGVPAGLRGRARRDPAAREGRPPPHPVGRRRPAARRRRVVRARLVRRAGRADGAVAQRRRRALARDRPLPGRVRRRVGRRRVAARGRRAPARRALAAHERARRRRRDGRRGRQRGRRAPGARRGRGARGRQRPALRRRQRRRRRRGRRRRAVRGPRRAHHAPRRVRGVPLLVRRPDARRPPAGRRRRRPRGGPRTGRPHLRHRRPVRLRRLLGRSGPRPRGLRRRRARGRCPRRDPVRRARALARAGRARRPDARRSGPRRRPHRRRPRGGVVPDRRRPRVGRRADRRPRRADAGRSPRHAAPHRVAAPAVLDRRRRARARRRAHGPRAAGRARPRRRRRRPVRVHAVGGPPPVARRSRRRRPRVRARHRDARAPPRGRGARARHRRHGALGVPRAAAGAGRPGAAARPGLGGRRRHHAAVVAARGRRRGRVDPPRDGGRGPRGARPAAVRRRRAARGAARAPHRRAAGAVRGRRARVRPRVPRAHRAVGARRTGRGPARAPARGAGRGACRPRWSTPRSRPRSARPGRSWACRSRSPRSRRAPARRRGWSRSAAGIGTTCSSSTRPARSSRGWRGCGRGRWAAARTCRTRCTGRSGCRRRGRRRVARTTWWWRCAGRWWRR
jgi:polyketide synthase 12